MMIMSGQQIGPDSSWNNKGPGKAYQEKGTHIAKIQRHWSKKLVQQIYNIHDIKDIATSLLQTILHH